MKTKNTVIIELENFDELWKIQDEEWDSTVCLDLCLIRARYVIADGYLLLCQPDCITHAKFYFMSWNTWNSLTEEEKNYIEQNYN